jgi:hypothetical protein
MVDNGNLAAKNEFSDILAQPLSRLARLIHAIAAHW